MWPVALSAPDSIAASALLQRFARSAGNALRLAVELNGHSA